MSEKPTYEELKKRVHDLEQVVIDREKTIETLKAFESNFHFFYHNAPLAYQSLDKSGHLIDVNRAWLDTLGYDREEVIGKSFGNFLHRDWKDHFSQNFPRFKAVGEVMGVEFEMIKKDGESIFVSFSGVTGMDCKGHFNKTHCFF